MNKSIIIAIALLAYGLCVPCQVAAFTGDAVIDLVTTEIPFGQTVPDTLPGGYKLISPSYYINRCNSADISFPVWLYIKMGPADGSQGDPIDFLYTVNVNNPQCESQVYYEDYLLMTYNVGNNKLYKIQGLNFNVGGDYLYLLYRKQGGQPIRCIVVNNYYDPPPCPWYNPFCWGSGNCDISINEWFWFPSDCAYMDKEIKWVNSVGGVKQDLNEGAGGILQYIGYVVGD